MKTLKLLLRLLLGIFLGGIGLWLLVWHVTETTISRDIWPTAQGVIVSSDSSYEREPPVSHLFSSHDWLVAVSFDYEIEGELFTWYQQWYESKAEAEKAKLKYSPGAKVTIYYNPKIPTVAVVEPEKRLLSTADLVFYMLFVAPFLGGGMILIVEAARKLRTRINKVRRE